MAITNDFDLGVRKKDEKKDEKTNGSARDLLVSLLKTPDYTPANQKSKEAVEELQRTGTTTYRGKTYTLPEGTQPAATTPVQTTTPSTGSGLKLPTVESTGTHMSGKLDEPAPRPATVDDWSAARESERQAHRETVSAAEDTSRAQRAYMDAILAGSSPWMRAEDVAAQQARVDESKGGLALAQKAEAAAQRAESAATTKTDTLYNQIVNARVNRKESEARNSPDFAALSQGDPETAKRANEGLGMLNPKLQTYYTIFNRKKAFDAQPSFNALGEATVGAELNAQKNDPYYGVKDPLLYISDEQAAIFFYLWHSEGEGKGPEAAAAYIDAIQPQLNAQRAAALGEANAAYAEASPVGASLESVAQNQLSILGDASLLYQNARRYLGDGKPVDYNSPFLDFGKNAQQIRSTVGAKLAEEHPLEVKGVNVANFLYQTGMSMADSSVQLVLNRLGIPEGVTLSLMSGSAMQQAVLDAKENGLSDGRALITGLAAGAAEYVFEKVSLDKFTETFFENTGKSLGQAATKKLKDGLAKKVMAALVDVGVQGLTEASEEAFTTIANTVADQIINGNMSELDRRVRELKGMTDLNGKRIYTGEEAEKIALKEWFVGLTSDAIGGFISGFGMGGAGVAYRGASQVAGDVAAAARLTAEQRAEESKAPAEPEPAKLTAPTVETQTAAQERAADPLTFVLNKAANGETITNSDAKAILDNPQAMQALRDSGVLTNEGTTASEQRAAVKEAVQALAQQESQARAETAPRQEAAQEAAEGAQGESNLRLPTVETNAETNAETQNGGSESGLTLPTVGDTVNETNRQEANNNVTVQEKAEAPAGGDFAARAAAGRQGSDRSGRDAGLGRFLENYRTIQAVRRGEGRALEAKEIRNAAEAGTSRRVSAQDMGLPSGTDNKSAILLDNSFASQHLGRSWDRAVREYAARGVTLQAMSGQLERQAPGGKTGQVRAYISADGKNIIVQADHPYLTWNQLLGHEELHRRIKEDKGYRKEVEDALLADEKLKPYLADIIDRYEQKYAEVDPTMTADEIIEEMLADYRAGFDMLDPLGLKSETRTATKAAAKDIRTVEKTRAKERKKTPKTAAESVEKYSLNPETIDYAVDYTVEDEKTKTQLRLLKDITSELADIQDRINKAVGGRAAKNIHELNDYLQEHKDVWQRLWDMQNELLENGIRCDFVTEPGKPNAIDGQEVPGGLKGLPIEYVASTTGKRYKFTAFWRNMPQMFLDSMTHDSRERLRTAIVKGVEDAYARRTGETDLMPYLKDQFPTRKEIEKVAGARTLKNVRNQTQARVQSPLRDAEKTVAALNLNSACPMFTIGNNGCYLDACYLTQMANGATGTNLFRSAWYTGELLQLADSDIKLMNDLGGLRVNGVGDTTLDNKSQLKDAIRHAGMRGLKVKMITKQRSTLEVLAEMHNSGEDISHVTVQPSMDNLWIPAELDDVYGAGVRGNTQLAETVKAGRNEAAASGYDEMFGRATKIEDGILWRKYGFSPEQIREMKEDFPFVTITPRYVVCTAAEIAEIALNRDGEYVNGGKVIQTLMHGKVPAGCVSDYPGEIINFGGARHVVERKDGKWHFYGEYIGKGGAVGKVIDGPNTPYGKVQKYVEDNYTKAEQDKIWLTLKNQMCCQANDFKDACAGCQSLCARGCAAFSAEDFDYRKYTEAEKARAMAMEEPVEDAPKAAAERAGATPEQAEANAKYSQEVNALTYFSGGGLVDHALRDVIGSSMAVEFDKGAAAVYALNNGDVFVGDVRDFSKSQLDKMRGVDYFHASPVCKNYSRMNRQRTLSADNDTDITTAQATADAIRELTPKVFTLEQVPGYKGSKAYNIIADTLTELGYAWDATVAKASDYGGATSRERLMLRAVKGGALPALPQKTEGYSWFEATADLIDGLDDTTMPKFLQDRIDRTPELLDEIENGDQPILILGGTNGGLAWWAPASKPCPSITTTLTDARVLMPDGTVKKADARFFARIMGLPDSYKFTQYRGKDNQVQGMKVIGNGVPVQLTQKFFGNLLDAELGTGVKYSAETDMNDEFENKLTQFAKAVDAPADFSAPDMLDSMYRLYRGELDNGRIVGPNADVNKARALAEEIDELVGRISDRREAIKNESVGDWALRMFEEQYRNPDKGLLEDLRDWGKEQRDFVDDWKGEWEPTALRHFYEAYERTDFSDINSIKRFFEDAEAAYKENGDRGVPVYGYYDETHGDNARYSREVNAQYNDEQDEVGSPLRTMAYKGKTGGNIERMGGVVGKNLGSTPKPWVYFHRDYLEDAMKVANIKQEDYDAAYEVLKKENPALAERFNHLAYNASKNTIMFGYSEDFDTAREPAAGETMTIDYVNGKKTNYQKNNKNIFHHKWLWVENDYRGFDHDGIDGMKEAWEWSKKWLNALEPAPELGGYAAPKGIADGSNIDAWNRQLDHFGLPRDTRSGTDKYSLNVVPEVVPSSDAWERGHDEAWFIQNGYPIYRDVSSDQAEANEETGQDKRGGKHGTQIGSTKSTYAKVYNRIKAEHPDDWQDLRILDASSGLGLGTRIGREMGFNVTDIEPFPSETEYQLDKETDNPDTWELRHPEYEDYSELEKRVASGETEGFDYIISNAVLNVIPQDTRDNLVVAMGHLLNPGGQMFINVISKDYAGAVNSNPEIQRNAKGVPVGYVRTAEGDYSQTGNTNGRGHETFVWKTNTVQKVFSYNELVAYLRDALGPGYTVQPFSKFGMTAAMVTKSGDGKTSLEIDPDVAEQYSPEAIALREQNRQRRREGKKKVSRVRSNAFEVGGLFDEVEQQMDETKPENYTYDPISEKKSMNEARRRLRNDMAGEEAKLSQPDYDWGGSDLDTAMGILHAKRAQARLTGDYSDFIEWSHVITEKGTKGGQFVQAFAKYSRTATEQARKAAENLGKQAQLNPAQQKKADKVTKRVKKAVDNAAGDAADNALKRAQRGRSDAENLIKEIHDIFKVSKDHGTDVKEWVDLTGEELAKKISSRFATPTSKAKTTMQTILGDLVRFAQEHALPTRQKAEGGRTAIDTITDYLNNRDAYGQAWAEAQSILRAIYANDQEKLDALDSFLTATISYNGTDFDRTMFDAILEAADTLGMTQDEIKKLAAVGLTDNTIDRIANGFISRVQANLGTDFDNSYEEQLRDAVRRHIIGVVAEDTPGARLLGMEKAAAKDLDIKLRELLTESKRTKADATARVARYLIDELGLTGADAAIAANTISESFMNELGRLSNEALQRLFMPGDESGMTKKQRDKLLELFRLGGFTNASVEDAVVDALGMGSVSRETQRRVMEDMARFADTLDDMTDDDLEGLRKLIREQAAVRNTPLSRMSERVLNGETDAQYLKDFAMAQLASIAGDYAPRSEGERISTFQTMSHLINARTALRNLTSNQVFDLVESAANNLSLVPDMVLGAITGQRTVGLDRSWASQLKRQGALQGAGRNALEVNLDVSPEGRDKSKYGTAGRRTNSMASSNAFRRILSHLEEVMGYELNTTDEFHKGSVRGETLDSLARMVERGDLTQEQANAFAEEEALYRSFQDDTLAGNLMGELKGLLNTIGFGNSKGRSNTKGRPIHDFGLGDLVVKYTQVPGALIHRGIEFSPLGYAKTLYDLALARDSFTRTRARGEDTTASQRRLALDIGRATTGTGLILLFAALAKMGLLRRDDDDKDKNAKAQHAAQGLSGTQLNLTALGRWLSGGDPSRKDGDVLSDIGFLEPMDSLMTIATLLAGEDEVKAATVGIKSLDGVWKAISNTSAMQTISNIISTVQYHDEENDLPLYFQIPIEIASDSVSGFIPSPVRQVAQATDTTYRDQYRSQDISDQVRAKVANSIPGVRKLLAPKITPLGEDKKYQAPVLNYLNATLNPGNINVYQANDVTDELDRLYAATEDAKIWPERNAPYSTSIDKVSYTLTPDERTQYQRTRGQLTAQMMEAVMGSAWYKQMDAGTQADVMNWIGNFANYAAKVEFADGRNIDYASDSYAKYYNAMKSGTPLADVVSQKYGKTVTFAEAGLSSQQISDLNNAGKKEEKLDYLQDAKMTDADKLKALSGVLGTDMTTSSGEPTQWAKVNTAVKDGISVDRAIEMMQDETLDYYIKWRDSDAKKAGIKSDTYLSYRADTSKMSADKDKNGKTISGSKKTKVMDYINKLSLTSKQKDTLYYDAGYAESKINEAPWHSGGGSSGGKNAPESFSRTLKLPTVEGQTAQTRSRLRLPTA